MNPYEPPDPSLGDRQSSVSRLTYIRGACLSLIMAGLGFAVPWLIVLAILIPKWWWLETQSWDRQYDFNVMAHNAWRVSYFLSSMATAVGASTYLFRPVTSLRENFCIIAAFAVGAQIVYQIVTGPRYRSLPQFGETWMDITSLILPSLIVGIVLIAFNLFRLNRPSTESAS